MWFFFWPVYGVLVAEQVGLARRLGRELSRAVANAVERLFAFVVEARVYANTCANCRCICRLVGRGVDLPFFVWYRLKFAGGIPSKGAPKQWTEDVKGGCSQRYAAEAGKQRAAAAGLHEASRVGEGGDEKKGERGLDGSMPMLRIWMGYGDM